MIKEKPDVINNAMTLLKEREMIYNGFDSKIFPLPNQSIVLPEPENRDKQSNQSHQKSQAHQSTQAVTKNIIHPKKKYQEKDLKY